VELSGNTFRGLARDVEDLRVGAVGTGAVSN
jgi:hypothetical protein